MTDDLIDWFKEADGFCGGTKAPHKWVLQAHSEIIFLRARIEFLRARLAEVEKERDARIDPDYVQGLVDLAEPMLSDALGAAEGEIAALRARTKEAVETLRVGFKSCDPTKTAAAIILAIAQLEGHGE